VVNLLDQVRRASKFGGDYGLLEIGILPSVKRLYAAIENRALDLVSSGKLLTRKTPPIMKQAQASVPTDWYFLKSVFADLKFDETDTILDVGCGTGRALLFLANRYPKSTVSGIELNPDVAAVARSVVRSNCEVITGDILSKCPPETNVFYLFNPFHEQLMVEFCETLLNTRDQYTVIYTVPSYLSAMKRTCTGNVNLTEKTVTSRLRGLDRQYAILCKDSS